MVKVIKVEYKRSVEGLFTVSHSGLNPKGLTPRAVLRTSSPMDFQDLMQDKGSGKVTLGQILSSISSYSAAFLRLSCSGDTVSVTWHYSLGHGTNSPQPGGAPVAPWGWPGL